MSEVQTQTVNDTVLATVKVDRHVIARFHDTIKRNHPQGWPVKLAGKKPSDAAFMAAAQFSTKNSVSEAAFVASCMRDGGCSITQLGYAFNCGPARNHRKALIDAGYFKGSLISGSYTLEFTKKGIAYLEKRLASLAAIDTASAPAKPKGKRNPKPATVPATVTVDAPAATPEADSGGFTDSLPI